MFEIGKLVVTTKIADAMKENDFTLEINSAYTRYRNRDWGEVKEGYKNDLALINEDDKILAEYNTSKGTVYITTECDRSITTILFAEEYRGAILNL